MDKLKLYLRELKEHKKLFQITAMVAIVIIAVFVFGQYGEKDEFSEQFAAGGEAQADQIKEHAQGTGGDESLEAAAEDTQIYVDIGGEVKTPGVYAVTEGTRLFEVIEKAGGLTEHASTAQINQAEVVADGQKVVIPTIGEEELWGTSPAETAAPAGKDSQGRININTADSDTLQEIPGVGPATAEKIIAYREENGRFSQIEEIQNVNGIGNKTFEKMKDKITV